MKSTHGGVIALVKLQASASLLHGHFPRFLNCTNGTKSRKALQLLSHFWYLVMRTNRWTAKRTNWAKRIGHLLSHGNNYSAGKRTVISVISNIGLNYIQKIFMNYSCCKTYSTFLSNLAKRKKQRFYQIFILLMLSISSLFFHLIFIMLCLNVVFLKVIM